MKAIIELKRPETKAQVRQALGLFGSFRDYIPHYAEHAVPLSHQTSKCVSNRIPWGKAEQKAFDTLKEM
jgi:hypothetical protein